MPIVITHKLAATRSLSAKHDFALMLLDSLASIKIICGLRPRYKLNGGPVAQNALISPSNQLFANYVERRQSERNLDLNFVTVVEKQR